MKSFVVAIALACTLASVPVNAQEVGVAFRNYGQCNSAISQYFTDDWQSLRSRDQKAYSQEAYVHHYKCVKIGDYWYIVPSKDW